jgi:hypothetical protein
LFFVNPQGRLCSASVRELRGGAPSFNAASVLNVPPIGFGHFGTQYDVSPDGQRIYFLKRSDSAPAREVHMVMGWRASLGVH